MVSYRTSRMIPTIITVLIIIVAIVGLVALARVIFSSNNSGSSAPSETTVAREALLDTTAGSAVRMSVRGALVADEDFRSYQVTITPNSRHIVTYKGYLDTVINQQKLDNNVAAYDQFVHALDKTNITAAKKLSDETNDFRGICATGRVYEFEILKDGAVKQQLWTSSCTNASGSLKANARQLTDLFTKQIPDATTYLKDLSLS